MTETQTIYGETVEDLIPGLARMAKSARVRKDGMTTMEVRMEASVARPLFSALMRAEAELLLEDADAYGSPGYEERTQSQRAADALVRLVDALAAH